VQNLLSVLPRVEQRQRNVDRVTAKSLQVRMELQSDCLVGLSMKHTNERKITEGGQSPPIDPADIDLAIMNVPTMPDVESYGTPDQRKRWFMNGFQQGTVAACNTFRAIDP
jgi:predicted metalloprotease